MAATFSPSEPLERFGLRRILLPLDGSDCSKTAMRYAFAIARAYGSEVHVVYVVNEAVIWALEGQGRQDEARETERGFEEEGEAILSDASKVGSGLGVRVVAHIERGIPFNEIVRASRRIGADMIVMGTKGSHGSRSLLGSTAEGVIRYSGIPVLVVPCPRQRE
ncbi:MAG: universal stress protein [Candidatus Bathyarchaeia archaeon]